MEPGKEGEVRERMGKEMKAINIVKIKIYIFLLYSFSTFTHPPAHTRPRVFPCVREGGGERERIDPGRFLPGRIALPPRGKWSPCPRPLDILQNCLLKRACHERESTASNTNAMILRPRHGMAAHGLARPGNARRGTVSRGCPRHSNGPQENLS